MILNSLNNHFGFKFWFIFNFLDYLNKSLVHLFWKGCFLLQKVGKNKFSLQTNVSHKGWHLGISYPFSIVCKIWKTNFPFRTIIIVQGDPYDTRENAKLVLKLCSVYFQVVLWIFICMYTIDHFMRFRYCKIHISFSLTINF